MVNITITIDGEKINTLADSLAFQYEGNTSIAYLSKVLFKNLNNNVILKLSKGGLAKISLGWDNTKVQNICQGRLIFTLTKNVNNDTTTEIHLEDEIFYIIKNTKVQEYLKGDLVSKLSIMLSRHGIPLIRSGSVIVPIDRYVDGYIKDILDILLKENGIAWNVNRGKIFVGMLLSNNYVTAKLEETRLFNNFIDYKDRIIRYIKGNFKFDANLCAGDNITISGNNYFCVQVNHQYFSQDESMKQSTTITALTKSVDIIDFITNLDPDDKVRDIAKFLDNGIKFYTEHGIVSYDYKTRKYVGELRETVFSGVTIANGGYLNNNGIITSSTFGFHVPEKIVLVGISYFRGSIAPTGNVSIEIQRDGTQLYKLDMESSIKGYKRLDVNLLSGSFISAVSRSALVISKIQVTLHYRILVF
jgi:hypothetical protein